MRWLTRALVVPAWLAVLAAAIGVAAHYLDSTATALVVLASFAPFLMACGVVGLLALAGTRRWVSAGIATVVLTAAAWTQLPLYVGDRAVDSAASDLTVMQANIFFGNSDLEGIVDQVRSGQVDVLTVNELTPAAVPQLGAAGLDEVLPFRYLRPMELGGGTGIWSRYPLAEETEHLGFVLNMLSARVQPPEERSFVVVAAHPLPPVPRPQTDTWASELGKVREILQRLRAGGKPVIVGADFNATYDHAQFRALIGDGYRDAAEQSGAGVLRTYPADRWWPPLLAIDHVLVSGVSAVSAEAVELPGSDHRGVVAEIDLRAPEDYSVSD
ncbi:endonuclease/exonuclease/phosphatase family protein [Rhodococcus sp. NPDC058514]|uniref:endonuclease/exonuclease/phosphatase family protein n=1 Tax=unclassified Rhodococcus (in: high G+C Gram-positive bacteria) TaxID=192944 RepID=UPI00365B3FF5